MPSPRPPTLKDIARRAQVSVSTVSYALRDAPNIPPATSARIRAAASALGYRPNPRVAELMAHIRAGRPANTAERLALLWPPGSPPDHFARTLAAAARARATERGYRLDSFLLADHLRHPRRLADILLARGIVGVLFGPASSPLRLTLDWPWDRFAMAVIGATEWSAPLSRACHHHYEAMRLVLEKLTAAGARRPVALLHAPTNERAHRGWQAAWLAYGPPAASRRLLLYHQPDDLHARLPALTPDALILDAPALLPFATHLPPTRIALLSRPPDAPCGGIEQGYDTIAAHAVDLVVGQLQRHERGLPSPPRSLLFPGRWIDPPPSA